MWFTMMCWKVGVAKCKFLLFFNLAFTYATTFPDLTFWKHVRYIWQATTLNVHCNLFSICHFVHISSITQNYGHLMSTRSILGKWKAVETRNTCRCMHAEEWPKVGVTGSECDWTITSLFLLSSYLYMQPHFQTSHLKIMKACGMQM